MEVEVPGLEIARHEDGLKTQALSQEVVMMRDGAWVFLYNEVGRSSPLEKRTLKRKGGEITWQ